MRVWLLHDLTEQVVSRFLDHEARHALLHVEHLQQHVAHLMQGVQLTHIPLLIERTFDALFL